MKNTSFTRNDGSILNQWWWTVDKWTLGAISLLILIGVMLIFAASPPVAERIGVGNFYFLKRHFIFLPVGIFCIFCLSLLSSQSIRRVGFVIFLTTIILLILVYFIGYETKGAKRWIHFLGFSLQPSEFIKPSLAILGAWMLSEQFKNPHFPGKLIFTLSFFISLLLLLVQPDIGMSLILFSVWFGQLFLAGLSWYFVGGLCGLGILGFGLAYLIFPHVHYRVQNFLYPSGEANYQVTTSLEAFASGGLFGQGPGEGVIKYRLPDAHADFIFAVAAEEYGLLLCFVIISLYFLIVFRGFYKSMQTEDTFSFLAVGGLMISFSTQVLINLSSTLHLIPTKGMTLPLISSGGTSLLGTCITLGLLLGLTKKRVK